MEDTARSTTKIFEKACLVQLSVKVWPGAKKIPKALAIEKLGSDWARAMKDIVDKKSLKPMEEVRTAAHRFLQAYTVPFPIRGIDMISKEAVKILDDFFKEKKIDMEEASSWFVDTYPMLQNEAEAALGPELFDKNDYPDNIKDKFDIDWSFFEMSPPTESSFISADIVRKEEKKFIETMNKTKEMVVIALRTQIKEMVDKCIDRLTPNEDGSRKTFHKTTVSENFLDFFETFKLRNIFEDKKLAKVVDQAKLIIEGVDIEELRNDDDFAGGIVKDMQKVSEVLTSLIGDAPTRKLKI